MADQAIINLFHGLGQEIGGLSSVIKTQGVFQDISPFFGDQKFYKSWIKSIDKHATLTSVMKSLDYVIVKSFLILDFYRYNIHMSCVVTLRPFI